jgi:hypothetical protein
MVINSHIVKGPRAGIGPQLGATDAGREHGHRRSSARAAWATRLRRWGFESAARDAGVLARHNRRYSQELPFGGIKDQQQSGNCWLFAPLVLARAAALKRGTITGTESFSETHIWIATPPSDGRGKTSARRVIGGPGPQRAGAFPSRVASCA